MKRSFNYFARSTFHFSLVVSASCLSPFAGYLVLGGWRLFRAERSAQLEPRSEPVPFSGRNWVTLGVILCVVVLVLFANADIGMAGMTGAVVLAALGVADHEQAIRRMPWYVARLGAVDDRDGAALCWPMFWMFGLGGPAEAGRYYAISSSSVRRVEAIPKPRILR